MEVNFSRNFNVYDKKLMCTLNFRMTTGFAFAGSLVGWWDAASRPHEPARFSNTEEFANFVARCAAVFDALVFVAYAGAFLHDQKRVFLKLGRHGAVVDHTGMDGQIDQLLVGHGSKLEV